MNDLYIVVTTAVIMIVLFATLSLALMKRYGRPIRKYDGYLEVSANDTSKIFKVDIRTEPNELQNQERVVLKVKKVLE